MLDEINHFYRNVSIPFKRESVSKVYQTVHRPRSEDFVSIPFKRESVSKVKTGQNPTDTAFSFNSLQTGKCIQSTQPGDRSSTPIKFQFPSNGKVYPKGWNGPDRVAPDIAFQFPSNGKAYPKKNENVVCFTDNCFNSLQTGKRIQSLFI